MVPRSAGRSSVPRRGDVGAAAPPAITVDDGSEF
jgi:hypothetical protein